MGPPRLPLGRGRRRGRSANFLVLLFLVVDVPVPFSDKFQQSNVCSDSVHLRLVDIPVVQQRQVPTVQTSPTAAVLEQGRCARWCATTGAWFDGAVNCGFSAIAIHRRSSISPVVLQRPVPVVLPVRKTIETPQLQCVAWWSMPLLCRSCLPCPLLCTTGALGSDSAEFRGGAAVAVRSWLWTSP